MTAAESATLAEVLAQVQALAAELQALKGLVGRPLPLLLRADEAAALLGMSRNSFDRKWKAGDLPQPVLTGDGEKWQRWKRKQLEQYAEKLGPGRRVRRRAVRGLRPADDGAATPGGDPCC